MKHDRSVSFWSKQNSSVLKRVLFQFHFIVRTVWELKVRFNTVRGPVIRPALALRDHPRVDRVGDLSSSFICQRRQCRRLLERMPNPHSGTAFECSFLLVLRRLMKKKTEDILFLLSC